MITKSSKGGLILEMALLFISLPIVLYSNLGIGGKIIIAFAAIFYVILISIRSQSITSRSLIFIKRTIWPHIVLRFAVIVVLTVTFVYFKYPDNLFIAIRQKPLLWAVVSLIYATLSVYPQEFVFRHFFIKRYGHLFKKTWVLFIVNATLFSFGHIMFENGLVLAFTFAGGLLFMHTYRVSNSLLYTSIEHSIYGVWLFTVGMGEMLDFPMP